jgi:hypothetical protein
MRFDENKTQTREREFFDIDNSNDLRIIREFEREINPYEGKSYTIGEKTVFSFEKYLHDNGIFRFSKKYPNGAVIDPQAYRLAWLKRRALDALRHKRFLLDKDNKA